MKPYYEDDACVIYHGDCRSLIDAVDAEVLCTDPPYGLGKKWAARAMVGRNGASRLWGHGETWDESPVPLELLASWIGVTEVAVVWGGNYYDLPPSRCWLIWDKVQAFSGADAELAWTNRDAAVRVFRMSRIEAYGANAELVKRHPTEKPVALMRWCLTTIGVSGTVVDPFMGSGTTLRAAKDLGRRAIGIEIEERYCEIAAKRLAQEVLPL